MVRVILVAREVGRQKPDYSLPFELPEIPRVGDYISVFRSGSETHTEDFIVRHVWWHLHSPETRAFVSGDEEMKVGRAQDIMVECDVALGPYAKDHWRSSAISARSHGIEVPDFKIDRFAVRESDLNN